MMKWSGPRLRTVPAQGGATITESELDVNLWKFARAPSALIAEAEVPKLLGLTEDAAKAVLSDLIGRDLIDLWRR